MAKPAEHSPAPTPSRAVRGFVGHLLATLAAAVYALWALAPDSILRAAGLDFLPQKYWAVALPIYLAVVFITFVFVVYPSLGMCVTHRVDDVRNVIDEHSIILAGGENSSQSGRVGDISPTDQLKLIFSHQGATE